MSWAERFRPRELDDLLLDGTPGLRALLEAYIRNAVSGGDGSGVVPHLLLVGPPGCGKTSIAGVLAREYYRRAVSSSSSDATLQNLLYINVAGTADRNGLAGHNQVIHNLAQTRHPFLPAHVLRFVVLDEVEGMSVDAQQALRRLIDAAAQRGNLRFVLVTNYEWKISPALLAVALTVHVQPPSEAAICARLERVRAAMGSTLPLPALQQIARTCDGDVRRAINELQRQCL